jgi:DNA repair photolyase
MQPYGRKDALKLLELDCKGMHNTGDQREILMSFTTDPYQPLNNELDLTREAIKLFAKYALNFSILTKGGKRSERDFDWLSFPDVCGRYGTTLTLTNPTDINKWEPFAAPMEERIHALSEAHRRDIPTWVSLEPIIDPAQSLALIRETLPYVDEYKIGKMNHLASTFPLEQLRDFAKEVKELLDSYEKKYMFKDSMKAYL